MTIAPEPVKPYVGWPATETEANSLLQALIEQAYEAQQKEEIEAT